MTASTHRLVVRAVLGMLLPLGIVSLFPGSGEGQVFLAPQRDYELTLSLLIVSATVDAKSRVSSARVMWSVQLPPDVSGRGIERELYLLWPGEIAGPRVRSEQDRDLAWLVEQHGLTAIKAGSVPVFTNRYGPEREERPAYFVTFILEDRGLGFSSPATLVRIPWYSQAANTTYVSHLSLTPRGIVEPKTESWLDGIYSGWQYRATIGVQGIGPAERAAYKLMSELNSKSQYSTLRLDKDAFAQIQLQLVNPWDVRIEQVIPSTADIRLSETLENTRVLSIPIDFSDPSQPNRIELHYRYFTARQAVLVTVALFIMSQFITPLIRPGVVRFWRVVTRSLVIRRGSGPPERCRGVLLTDTLASSLVAGETPYDAVVRTWCRLAGDRSPSHRRISVGANSLGSGPASRVGCA